MEVKIRCNGLYVCGFFFFWWEIFEVECYVGLFLDVVDICIFSMILLEEGF